MKDELGVKIITEFATLTPKAYSCLTDESDKSKKARSTKIKKSFIKQKLKIL